MQPSSRPLPRITLDSKPFWDSCKAHAMRLQRCSSCGAHRYYPNEACPVCTSLQYEWVPVSGKGEIYSWTLLERARGNPFEGETPFVIVLVTLDEGPVIMSNLVGYEDDELRIGQRVVVGYEDVDDEVTVPIFRPER